MAAEQVRVTFIELVGDNRLMYYQGFKYKQNKERNARVYWRYAEPRCKTSAITELNNLSSADGKHAHNAFPFAIGVHAFKSKLNFQKIPVLHSKNVSTNSSFSLT